MSALAAELPLSPELVLVSPPEVASLARTLLPDPEPARKAFAAAPRARARPAGVVGFYAFCFANCLTPLVLALAASH
jgi:hypothetical protein